SIAGHWRKLEGDCLILAEELLQLLSPLREGEQTERFPVELEQVEKHELRGRRSGELPDATFGGMQSKLERLERQSLASGNDQLAVEQELPRFQSAQHVDDIGKVTRERLSRLGGQRDFAAVAPGETAKAIPLRLILPAFALGQLGRKQRFHRRRDLQLRHAA